MQIQALSLPSSNMKFIFFLALSLFLQGALGDLICEELPVEMCALSIASDGKRCVLESRPSDEGTLEMECQTSEAFASNKMLQEYIESDECVGACGVDRQSLGLSSDALHDSKFIVKLCSHHCYNNCPNIIDLYSSVASAEGLSLPEMCKARKTRPRPRRVMSQSASVISSGAAAPVVSSADPPVGSNPVPYADPPVGSDPISSADPPVGSDPVSYADPPVGSDPVSAAAPSISGDDPVSDAAPSPSVVGDDPVSDEAPSPSVGGDDPVSDEAPSPSVVGDDPVSDEAPSPSVVGDDPVSDEAPSPSQY